MNQITSIDISILNFIRENLTNRPMDMIMTTITRLGDGGLIWIGLTLIFIISKKYRLMGKVSALAMAINGILVNLILKPLIARPRPFDLISGTHIIIGKPRDFSFPSGHTSVAFAFLFAVIFFSKSKILKVLASILAILMGFSRLYLYVHYPSDVLVGAILGGLCGLLAKNIYEKGHLEKYFGKKIE